MTMKRYLFFIVIMVPVVFGCENEKYSNHEIIITTDKSTYTAGEKVAVKILNNSDSIAAYFVCSGYKGISPLICKFEDDNWTGFWSPICNGFSSYCCDKLPSHSTYLDTLNLQFDSGIYRIEYNFILNSKEGYQPFYLGNFIVK